MAEFEIGVSKNIVVGVIIFWIVMFILYQQDILNWFQFLYLISIPIWLWAGSRKEDIEKILGRRAKVYSLPDIPTEITKIKTLLLDMGIKGVEFHTIVGEPEFTDPFPKTLHYIFSYETKGKDGTSTKKKMKVSQSVTERGGKGLGIYAIIPNFKPVDSPSYSRSGAKKFPKTEGKEQTFQIQPIPIIMKSTAEQKEEKEEEEEEKKDEGKEDEKEEE